MYSSEVIVGVSSRVMTLKRYSLLGRRTLRLLALTCLVPAITGCFGGAQVQSKQLPVKRVVVYRNGVAYFERAGEVDADQVHFQLRKENVGDFLATLAVLEKGGQTVRAASFPVELEGEGDEAESGLQSTLDAWEGRRKEARELRRVTLELGQGKHDLTVGYLAETPLWRPSYRLVVGEDRKAVLQAWGIVQNQSGEDWEDVEIALVAGAPIAFESNLGDPVIPRRPLVTDAGEVITQVPQGQTTYGRREMDEALAAEEAEQAAEVEAEPEMSAVGSGAARGARKKARAPRPKTMASSLRERAAADLDRDDAAAVLPSPAPGGFSSSPRDPGQLSRVELQTGATRYEVPHRVTIPDQSATMVLLVSKEVAGEAVHLYSPDPGVTDSFSHPFRVARFKNESGGLLERGPIAVFEEGAFLGQGMVDSLPAGGRATVPFALMRSLSIRREMSHDQRGARLYSIHMGKLTIERDQVTIYAYHVENGDKEKARVLIKHQLSPGAKLWDPPKGTEELVKAQEVLSPIDVPGLGKASLMLEERHASRRVVDFRSTEGRTAIRDYLKSEQISQVQRSALELILKHAAQLQAIEDQETQLTREQRELERSTSETRRSLKAISENKQAGELRKELTRRLAQGTKRLDAITKDLVELRLRRTEQELRLRDAKQGLEVARPTVRKTNAAPEPLPAPVQ